MIILVIIIIIIIIIIIKFFFCVFMDRDEVEVNKLAKKERDQYPAILTEQTWSIKDLLYGFRGSFSCGIQRVVPSRQDGSILPARAANHITRFGSSCPLSAGGASHIIINNLFTEVGGGGAVEVFGPRSVTD